jgi:hypothetical protein
MQAQRIYKMIEGNVDAQPAIEAVVLLAKSRLDIFDVSLKDRGFTSPGRIDAMRKTLLANRSMKIRVALHQPESFAADFPRLMILMQQFSANFAIHRTKGAGREANDPLIIADGEHFWHKLHKDHSRSILTLYDAIETQPWVDRFEEIWESSELAVSAFTVGL